MLDEEYFLPEHSFLLPIGRAYPIDPWLKLEPLGKECQPVLM